MHESGKVSRYGHTSTCCRIGAKLRCIRSTPTEIESSNANDFECYARTGVNALETMISMVRDECPDVQVLGSVTGTRPHRMMSSSVFETWRSFTRSPFPASRVPIDS